MWKGFHIFTSAFTLIMREVIPCKKTTDVKDTEGVAQCGRGNIIADSRHRSPCRIAVRKEMAQCRLSADPPLCGSVFGRFMVWWFGESPKQPRIRMVSCTFTRILSALCDCSVHARIVSINDKLDRFEHGPWGFLSDLTITQRSFRIFVSSFRSSEPSPTRSSHRRNQCRCLHACLARDAKS